MTSIDDNLTTLGIKPVGSETLEPFSLNEVAKIEEAIGAQLPETYKYFVMKYGKSMFSTGRILQRREHQLIIVVFSIQRNH